MLKIVPFFCIILFIIDLKGCACQLSKNYKDFYFYNKQGNVTVTYMMMPEDNGIVVSAILGGVSSNRPMHNQTITFLLWTRVTQDNPEQASYNINTTNGFNFKNYNLSRKTIFLIHGFTDHYLKSDFFNVMVKVLLRQDDYNIIGVDWSYLSSIPWYAEAVTYSAFAGVVTSQAINDLRNLHPDYTPYIHIITYNLGALVAQTAAVLVDKKIERITGLDPPQILTDELPVSRRLNKEAAELVEVIHTSGDYLGITEPVGHRDFYPNGGKWPQPGCIYDIADRCSPRLAYIFYAEAILGKNTYVATRCTDYKAYLEKKCSGEPTIRLFNDVSPRLQGKFYFSTSNMHPLSGSQRK